MRKEDSRRTMGGKAIPRRARRSRRGREQRWPVRRGQKRERDRDKERERERCSVPEDVRSIASASPLFPLFVPAHGSSASSVV